MIMTIWLVYVGVMLLKGLKGNDAYSRLRNEIVPALLKAKAKGEAYDYAYNVKIWYWFEGIKIFSGHTFLYWLVIYLIRVVK